MVAGKTYNNAMPVLDAHTHLFPPFVIERREEVAARDDGFSVIYGRPASRMVDANGLVRYMDEEDGPDLVVAVGFPFKDGDLVRRCNDYTLEAAEREKRIIPFVSVNPKDGDAALAEAERCFGLGARGIGELAYYDTGFSENERRSLQGLAELLEQKEGILMLHLNEQVGHPYPGKSRVDFASVVGFVEDHPSLKVILAHMGGGICFYEFMPEIRKAFDHVYYDIAAAPYLYSEDLYAFAAAFLHTKVLFGSDYPLLSLVRYRRHLEKLDDKSRAAILYENGRRLFGA
jgi:uncharacterized protein